MNSRSVVLLGAQQPRVRSIPRSGVDRADGEEAVDLAAAYGLVAEPWQGDVVGNWMARRRDGRLAAGRCGLTVARQNGKNGVVEIVELHKMVAQGRCILHTAHEVKTARKAFLRLKSFFENERHWPELAALVKEVRQTNGQEAIFLHSTECDRRKDCGCRGGASIEFVARSRGSGRGFTVDDLVCDEAQELTDEQLEALKPTISAAPSNDPQTMYLGTVPSPTSPGTVFLRVRTEGVAGRDQRLSWDEWSIPDDMPTAEAIRKFNALVPLTNPALGPLGSRLLVSTVEDELGDMSPEGVCRERLGKWPSKGGEPPTIVTEVWNLLRAEPPTAGRLALGVKFSLDGTRVSLAAVRRPADGPAYGEVIAERLLSDGLGWLVDVIVKSWKQTCGIVIDGKAGRDLLVGEVVKVGVPRRMLITPTTDEVIAAHTMTLQAINDGTFTHGNQPGLNASVRSAAQRKIGNMGGWGWEPIADGDIVPLESVTLALWAASTSKLKATGSVPRRIS